MGKEYRVTLDVFFMETHHVTAKNKAEAIEKAKDLVNHGMGEEVALYEIEVERPNTNSTTTKGE